MTYSGEESHVDSLEAWIDTTERDIEDDTYHIWTKKLPVCQLPTLTCNDECISWSTCRIY